MLKCKLLVKDLRQKLFAELQFLLSELEECRGQAAIPFLFGVVRSWKYLLATSGEREPKQGQPCAEHPKSLIYLPGACLPPTCTQMVLWVSGKQAATCKGNLPDFLQSYCSNV